MTGSPVVVVARDAEALAAETADRLLTALVDAQAARGSASVVLTGGGVGIATLSCLRAHPAVHAVGWPMVDVWWGDERFLPAGHPDRNETQARTALLDALPLDPVRVHPMGAAGEAGRDDVDDAAARYAEELAGAAGPGRAVPVFDVLMLGMGAEGHTASIFPESPAARDQRSVVGVHGCPKPPPTRISMGPTTLQAARDVWVIVAGEEKAAMVALALEGAGPVQVPAAGARGSQRTMWLLDEAAASRLPQSAAPTTIWPAVAERDG